MTGRALLAFALALTAPVVARSESFAILFAEDARHDARLQIVSDLMTVAVDGTPVADLGSPRIAHETKTSVHFTVNGPGMRFDDVRIRSAR